MKRLSKNKQILNQYVYILIHIYYLLILCLKSDLNLNFNDLEIRYLQ